MQCGIQLTMSALNRSFHSGLSMEYRLVWCTSSCCFGAGFSAFTVSVDSLFVSPLSALSLST